MKTPLPKICAALLVVFALVSTHVFAISIYVTGVNTGAPYVSKFGTLDLNTGVYTQISANMSGGFANLTYGPTTGLLYASVTTGTGTLHTVNTGTGNATLVGYMGYDVWAMSMGPSSQIFAYNWASDTLNWVNPATAASTLIAATPTYASRPPEYGSYAFIGSTLYTSANYGSGSIFGTVNTTDGTITTLASDAIYQSLKLAYDGTTLYGVNLTNIFTINPATGALSSPVTITGANWFTGDIYGASYVPVPEPSTLSMVAVFACGAALAKWRNRSKIRGGKAVR